jgi:DNA-binding NarL/FixJ family response regulator
MPNEKPNMDDLKQITFIVADDHAIVREGIVAFCQSRPELKIIGSQHAGFERP